MLLLGFGTAILVSWIYASFLVGFVNYSLLDPVVDWMSSQFHRLHISSAYEVFLCLTSWKAAHVFCPGLVGPAVPKNQRIIINKDISHYHLGSDSELHLTSKANVSPASMPSPRVTRLSRVIVMLGLSTETTSSRSLLLIMRPDSPARDTSLGSQEITPHKSHFLVLPTGLCTESRISSSVER